MAKTKSKRQQQLEQAVMIPVDWLDTQDFQTLTALSVDSPSGIFFTARAARMGF